MPAAVVCKQDVVFAGFRPALVKILAALVVLSERYVIMVTSGSEGTHDPQSRHYTFEALDIKSKHYSREQRAAFIRDLMLLLGPAFTVLLENAGEANEHIHVQVRKGTTYTLADFTRVTRAT